MKKINDQFVSYEIAVRMKELGFNLPCFASFWTFGDNVLRDGKYGQTEPKLLLSDEIEKEEMILKLNAYRCCKAPIWQQAIDWLSEVHNIEVDASRYTYSGGIYQGKVFAWFVDQYDPKYNHELEDNENHWIINTRKSQGYDFKSKHDALKEGINYALKLIEGGKNK